MEWIPDLERFVLEKMASTKLSAVSMACVSNGEVIYKRGFGLKNRELGLAATPATNYCIGSVTKSFTCLALMQLQERGLLNVDDPVELYLPLQVRPSGEPIRLRHLMSHSSGLPALAYLENLLRYHHGAVDRYLPIGGISDMLEFCNSASDWVESQPGERWFYLNEGYVILGAVIEKVSGVAYRDYVRENILLPLGMQRSYHSRELFVQDPDTAVPYALNAEGRHLPREYPWGQAEPDGGLISNAEDMAKYVNMYLSGGTCQYGRIISAESLNAMTQKIVRTPPEDVVSGEPVSYYGFGLQTQDLFSRQAIGHSGSMFVATCGMRFIPEEGVGVVVHANGSGYPPITMADYALARMLGEEPLSVPSIRIEKILEELTGHYDTYRGTYSCTVRKKGDYLMLEYSSNYGTDSTVLVPVELGPEHSRFHVYMSGRRHTAEFFHRGEHVELLNERYKYRRVGRLT